MANKGEDLLENRHAPAKLSGPQSFVDYQRARYFPSIDGLRAISVLAVISFHVSGPFLSKMNGYLGVTIFFVISGFLITTLLLREEAKTGRVSIRNFYLRRIFRIFPLYYTALGIYAALTLGLGLGSDPLNFQQRLPMLALYLGEFTGTGTFSHSWSLGIEEKYYLVWPALCFLLARERKMRVIMAGAIACITALAGFAIDWSYFSIYTPLLLGSLLALGLGQAQIYNAIAGITKLPYILSVVTGAVLLAAINSESGYSHNLFALVVTVLIAQIIVRPHIFDWVLTNKVLRYIGTRAYGIYLFHPLLIRTVEKLPVMSNSGPLSSLALFLTVAAATLVLADLAYRTLERPLIQLGHRLTQTKLPVKQTGRRSAASREGEVPPSVEAWENPR